MRNFIFMAGLFCLTACFDSESSAPKLNLIPSTDDMLCERHPGAVVVDEKISSSDNPCEASAKIQAIAYECGDASDTDSFVRTAFLANVEKAREKCDEFCKNQSSSCEGVFSAPSECGLKSFSNLALDFGKNTVHCPTTCKGQAFNYCSIYHANFFAVGEKSLFKGMRENCSCAKK